MRCPRPGDATPQLGDQRFTLTFSFHSSRHQKSCTLWSRLTWVHSARFWVMPRDPWVSCPRRLISIRFNCVPPETLLRRFLQTVLYYNYDTLGRAIIFDAIEPSLPNEILRWKILYHLPFNTTSRSACRSCDSLGFQSEGHHLQKITAPNNMMAPTMAINIGVIRPSTENFGAAEPGELELEPEPEPEPESEFDDEPEAGVGEGAEVVRGCSRRRALRCWRSSHGSSST